MIFKVSRLLTCFVLFKLHSFSGGSARFRFVQIYDLALNKIRPCFPSFAPKQVKNFSVTWCPRRDFDTDLGFLRTLRIWDEKSNIIKIQAQVYSIPLFHNLRLLRLFYYADAVRGLPKGNFCADDIELTFCWRLAPTKKVASGRRRSWSKEDIASCRKSRRRLRKFGRRVLKSLLMVEER